MANEVKKFLDEEGVRVLWNQISLKDYPNNATLVAVINAIDETKQDKDLIITKNSNGLASKTPAEILEYIQNGGKVFYYDNGIKYEFLEGDTITSVFYSSFVTADKIEFTTHKIFADKTIQSAYSEYTPPVSKDYVDVRVPAWTEADEGKVLGIVNGKPSWVSLVDNY